MCAAFQSGLRGLWRSFAALRGKICPQNEKSRILATSSRCCLLCSWLTNNPTQLFNLAGFFWFFYKERKHYHICNLQPYARLQKKVTSKVALDVVGINSGSVGPAHSGKVDDKEVWTMARTLASTLSAAHPFSASQWSIFYWPCFHCVLCRNVKYTWLQLFLPRILTANGKKTSLAL